MLYLNPPRLNPSYGKLLETAFEVVQHVVCQHHCYFKVGICFCLTRRWQLYHAYNNKWMPKYMFVLLAVQGRCAVGWAEAALIARCRTLDVDPAFNINSKNKYQGGTGSRQCPDAEWFLYLAVLPEMC